MDLIKIAEQAFAAEAKNFPEFKAGDTVTVTYRIKEENKERLQKFRGVVIQRRGAGSTQTFTVRKISNGVGVERIFPLNSPFISEIEVNKVGKVRRARIFYLRNLTGKKARIKEKKFAGTVAQETGAVETAAAE
ncbi:MAG TPA: 50S ribosomal protein L19 [Candidatus Coprenecus stercoripullorum]|nr:50S ribosomal protein L19 [Candidatus Coprenecus stercoripullorum]